MDQYVMPAVSLLAKDHEPRCEAHAHDGQPGIVVCSLVNGHLNGQCVSVGVNESTVIVPCTSGHCPAAPSPSAVCPRHGRQAITAMGAESVTLACGYVVM